MSDTRDDGPEMGQAATANQYSLKLCRIRTARTVATKTPLRRINESKFGIWAANPSLKITSALQRAITRSPQIIKIGKWEAMAIVSATRKIVKGREATDEDGMSAVLARIRHLAE